jgi:hypothetical protein
MLGKHAVKQVESKARRHTVNLPTPSISSSSSEDCDSVAKWQEEAHAAEVKQTICRRVLASHVLSAQKHEACHCTFFIWSCVTSHWPFHSLATLTPVRKLYKELRAVHIPFHNDECVYLCRPGRL